MNKKSESGLTIVFSILFLVIVLTIFWVFSFINRGVIREETSDQLEINNINIDLLNLLRTQVDNITISDLIAKSYNEDDYSKLNSEINNIFENYFDSDYCWTLSILEDNTIKQKIHDTCGGKQLISEVKIPTLNSKDLTIKLSRYGLKYRSPYHGGIS
ncbi:MAG: hypothetical protein ISS82_02890 [Nanoarchaeota archaeon]|nr:hypothetical protein [Nanoarchaeota archaeon]